MRTLRGASTVLTIVTVAACTAGGNAGEPRRRDEGAVVAVRAALDTSVAAWNRGDLEGHVAVYADSAVFRPVGAARGRVQARRVFAPFFADASARPRLSIDSLSIGVLGPEHVLATGQYVLDGGRVDVARRGWFTEVWARTPDGWRIVLDHSS